MNDLCYEEMGHAARAVYSVHCIDIQCIINYNNIIMLIGLFNTCVMVASMIIYLLLDSSRFLLCKRQYLAALLSSLPRLSHCFSRFAASVENMISIDMGDH